MPHGNQAPGSTRQRDQWCCWQEVATSMEHQALPCPCSHLRITPQQARESAEPTRLIASPPPPAAGGAQRPTVGQTQVTARARGHTSMRCPQVSRLSVGLRGARGSFPLQVLPPPPPAPTHTSFPGCHRLSQAPIQELLCAKDASRPRRYRGAKTQSLSPGAGRLGRYTGNTYRTKLVPIAPLPARG